MKTLYNTIQEGLLTDIDTALARGAYDVIISRLFSTNLQQRREAFDELRSMVEAHRPKRHKTTNKMKNSDSYFVEFTWPLGIQNGEATEILDYITYMQICKQKGMSYITTIIDAADDRYATHNNIVHIFELSWHYTQSNFNPKASNTKLYEVPEELNSLFERIQMEAYNHR